MEQAPFDGVIMEMEYTRDGQKYPFSWHCFGGERIEPALVQHAIEDLQNTRFTTLCSKRPRSRPIEGTRNGHRFRDEAGRDQRRWTAGKLALPKRLYQ